MARIGVLLLLLIQWSNLYAWSCYYNNGEDGWYDGTSMVCDGIEVSVAIETHYCEWYRPDDPYCAQFQVPTCVDVVEYKTEMCPTNYTGAINYSRNYSCQTLSFTEWVESSNNCTALPPSCVESTESRTMACPSGYEGQITETRISSCPNPYAEPLWLEWLEENNTCKQSVSDPQSPLSVTNPISPVSPINTESAIAPQIDAQNSPVEPSVSPATGISNPNQGVGIPKESNVSEKAQTSSKDDKKSSTDKSDSTDTKNQSNNDGQKNDSKDRKNPSINSPKEIVHGFGLVLSLELLNKPMEFYQPPLVDPFTIAQEFPIHESTREFQLDLLKRNDIENYYYSISDDTWDGIRRSDILQ